MPKFKDLTNQRFGRLVALKRAENDRQGQVQWRCACDCGKTAVVRTRCLTSGHSRSCGCLRKALARERLRTAPIHRTIRNPALLERVYQWRRAGRSIRSIARSLGVRRSTVRAWLQPPETSP